MSTRAGQGGAPIPAVANTLIGLILLASGIVGAVASTVGAVWTIAIFAGFSVLGGLVALGLDEVEAVA